jgi:hypothetical protein
MFTNLKNNPIAALLSRWWPLLYIFIVTALLYTWFSNWAYDDPYITYRYAQNLAHGVGFVYNPGERVLSTTTPLFAILLAILYHIWDNLPRWANLISALSLALGAVFLWDLAQTWKAPAIGWAALLLYPTFPLMLTTMSSETPLYLALCLGAFSFYARGSYPLTALFAALAVLTRPDGILVPAILALDYLIRIRRPIPWNAVLLFIIITMPWFIFAWSYFGSPIPVTLAAKQGQGSMAISERFAFGFVTMVKQYVRSQHYRIEAVLVIFGIGYLVWRSYHEQIFRRWLFFFGWVALYFLSYSILGVSRYFWYYAPLVPGIIACVGLGAASVVLIAQYTTRFVLRHYQDIFRSTNMKTTALVLTFILIAVLAVFQVKDLNRIRQHVDSRIHIYRAVGEWLQSNTNVDAKIGTLEVGVIGYYAQRSILGFAGLLEPNVAAYLSENTTYEDTALWAVEEFQPAYLVLQEGAFPKLEQGYAAYNCQIVKQFPGDHYNYSQNMNIYSCEK